MATVAVALPRTRRRPRTQPTGGRAGFTDIYFVKRIDNSRLHREVDREKRRECFCLLGLGVLVFLFGLHVSWQSFQCVRDGYQIEAVKAQRADLEEWNHQLRLEQASLADPQRIDNLARRELGLASPAPQQVIRVGDAADDTGEVGSPELARNLPALGEIPREP
ncbi:MAG: cell division protein FtsL [Acidobacteriia bacterium]|jgi:cell division protein FtsL|nr:cell division protein FtsL [Terriglobia bacterium]